MFSKKVRGFFSQNSWKKWKKKREKKKGEELKIQKEEISTNNFDVLKEKELKKERTKKKLK